MEMLFVLISLLRIAQGVVVQDVEPVLEFEFVIACDSVEDQRINEEIPIVMVRPNAASILFGFDPLICERSDGLLKPDLDFVLNRKRYWLSEKT